MLTQSEIDAIKAEAELKYPKPQPVKIPDDYYNEEFTDRVMEMEIYQRIHIEAATEERQRAKVLLDALERIKVVSYSPGVLKLVDIAIDAYNKPSQQP